MLVAVAWVGVTLAAAWVSVDREQPYSLTFLDRAGVKDQVGQDWLAGWGTGFAAPMAAVAAVAVVGAFSAQTGRAGRLAAFVLALLGGASIAFTLSNRPSTARLRALDVDTTESGLLIATLALAALLVLLGFMTWLTAPRDRWS